MMIDFTCGSFFSHISVTYFCELISIGSKKMKGMESPLFHLSTACFHRKLMIKTFSHSSFWTQLKNLILVNMQVNIRLEISLKNFHPNNDLQSLGHDQLIFFINISLTKWLITLPCHVPQFWRTIFGSV